MERPSWKSQTLMLPPTIRDSKAVEGECLVVEEGLTTTRDIKVVEVVLLNHLKCQPILTLIIKFQLPKWLHIRIILEFNSHCHSSKIFKVTEVAEISDHGEATTIVVEEVIIDLSIHQDKMYTRAQEWWVKARTKWWMAECMASKTITGKVNKDNLFIHSQEPTIRQNYANSTNKDNAPTMRSAVLPMEMVS